MVRSRRCQPPTPRSASAAVATNDSALADLPSASVAGAAGGVRIAIAGSAVGLLTGFFGVGGGFIIVPALVLALGLGMTEAVATSMIVIVINSVVALGARIGDVGVDWAVVAPFALSSIAGVLYGSQLAGRHDPARLQRWFAGLLVAVAVYTIARSLFSLS
jgi:uncharacterized membrane protein YfcA